MTDNIRVKALWMAERGYEWKSKRLFRKDAGSDPLFWAYHPNLDCPSAYGATHKEAKENLDVERVTWIERLLKVGKAVPRPVGDYWWEGV